MKRIGLESLLPYLKGVHEDYSTESLLKDLMSKQSILYGLRRCLGVALSLRSTSHLY